MARDPIPSWFFAMVVVRSGDRFLLVEESQHGGGWYLPAGRVEPGESFAAAAHRETLEEAGIPVELEGVLAVQHTARPDYSRVRIVLVASPADDTPPKSVPDEESLRADWFTFEQIRGLRLRGPEALEIPRALRDGCPVHPMSLLRDETWFTP
jgi:ADP-ribose pyrophosphatase YjhB (NUDIX family)